MTADHTRYGEWAAAYALGALDEADRRQFESHLAACDHCAAELSSLAPLPALIAKIDPAQVGQRADPARANGVALAARQEIHDTRRRIRRWQRAAAGFAAAAVALGALFVVATLEGDDASSERAASVSISTASSTELVLRERAWGTEIMVDITGLPARDGYRLWTVDTAGAWISAAAWAPTPTGVARLTGASSSPVERIERILVTSPDRGDLLVEASP